MMLRTLTFFLFLSFSLISAGQQVKAPTSKMKFDIGPEISYPLNSDFHTTHSIGFGATSRAAYYFTDEISTGIRVGYDYFISRKYAGPSVDTYYNLTWTSFLANFQYDFPKNVYIGGDAGVGLLSIKGSSNSMFNTSLYIGKAVTFGKSTLGISLHWTQARESSDRNETVGIRAAYRFN